MWEILVYSDTGWKLWNFLHTEFEISSLKSVSTKIWKVISFTEFVQCVVEETFRVTANCIICRVSRYTEVQ